MKINLGKFDSLEALQTTITEKLGGKDAGAFSLRGDRKGNLWLVDKDSYKPKFFVLKESKRAAETVAGLIDRKIETIHRPGLKGDYIFKSAGLLQMNKIGVLGVTTSLIHGHIPSKSQKFMVADLLGERLATGIRSLESEAERVSAWKDFTPTVIGTNTKAPRYIANALSSDRTEGLSGTYGQLCAPGKGCIVDGRSIYPDTGARSISFTPAPPDGGNQWFHIDAMGANNKPTVTYVHEGEGGNLKTVNEKRVNAFDKFRISVHPDDMEKAFKIVWKHIGPLLCTDASPPICGLKVHDNYRHANDGKTYHEHQFTLYLPLPDELTDVFGDKVPNGHKGDQPKLTADQVNNANNSEARVTKFTDVMKAIQEEFVTEGIRPRDLEGINARVDTDYDIKGSPYFSMRNEVLNSRGKDLTNDERELLSKRQMTTALEGVLAPQEQPNKTPDVQNID